MDGLTPGQLDEIEHRVLQAFADPGTEDIDFDAMTAAELTAFVMAAVRGEQGAP